MQTRETEVNRGPATAERDRIVLDYLPLVKAIASRLYSTLPQYTDLDDLINVGVLGLLDAATRYKKDLRVPFAGYAKHRIRGAMLDSLRRLDWASRDSRRRQKAVEDANRRLSAELQRNPTQAEIAKELGVTLERWHRMNTALHTRGVLPSRLPHNQNGVEMVPQPRGNPKSEPDKMCECKELQGALASAIKNLPAQYQQVVVLYYSQELNMREIGAVLGVNESRVSQIHHAALGRMNVTLRAKGIQSCRAFA